MPVREALRQLEAEGFVKLLPNRGAVVRELSVQDIKEVYQIRVELEGLAARLAAPRVALLQLERLRRLQGYQALPQLRIALQQATAQEKEVMVA